MIIYEIETKYRVAGKVECKALDKPERVVEYMAGAFDENPYQESFWVIGLNCKLKPMFRKMVFLGALNQTLADSKEIFRTLFSQPGVAWFLIVHNHPSGDPTPSDADYRTTRKINEGAAILDLPLVDHIIIGDKTEDPNGLGYYSFKETGLL